MVAGKPTADPAVVQSIAAQERPLPADEALGDFRTIDYCSLFAGLDEEFGRKVHGPAIASFTKCGYLIGPRGANLLVQVGWLEGLRAIRRNQGSPVAGAEYTHGLRLKRIPREDTVCVYGLRFPGNMRLSVSAYSPDGTVKQHCSTARKAADTVVAVVAGGTVEHYTYPRGSFGRLKPCLGPSGVLTSEQASNVLEVEIAALSRPNGHDCRLQDDFGSDPSAQVYLNTTPSERYISERASAEEIAGRKSYVRALEHDGCVASTLGISNAYMYDDSPHDAMIEVANVAVFNVKDGQPCKLARALAEHAWPKLPKA